ncbi:LOW QUALITY PROTEIN: T-cell surface glycoprotein CD8 alpha chain-like [Numida meleagris]|uniref:LOW QUALITY PROTEIN: T-cell surface glycoprotein CD8 alpha chain-like n=1 Tax=Numida meleagris TaxID=8996 RepID=UPI000B3DE5E0|nr:LOW QUALITY PROTEIN: T-cell surface glycoprotein CD8 alpha chain-like [Numida meleagris]
MQLESAALSTLTPQALQHSTHACWIVRPSLRIHPHSPAACLPCTGREEPCPKAPGALPTQDVMGHGQLLPTGCTTTQGQRSRMEARFLDRNMKHPQEGQQLHLECWHFNRDSGLSWIRLNKDGNLHFTAYTSTLSKSTFPGNKRTSPQFEVSKQGNCYQLVVKSFRAQDQGTYFCDSYINQELHFSSGQPAFLPGQQQLHPPRLHTPPLPVPFRSIPLPTLPISLLLCTTRLITHALLLLIQAPCPPAPLALPALPKHRGGHSPAAPPHPISASQG